jgi:uncharacterized protein (DUF58 family)
MLSDELLEAVKHLEIVAKEAVDETLAGEYESVFKGRGLDFTGVREYQPGDDIRVIDWNVSARMNELHVKQYVEERELTVFLLVDASSSQNFATRNHRPYQNDSEGTQSRTKLDTATELAALVAFSAIENNDRVGLMTFSDVVESLIPPDKGRKHVMRILTQIEESQAHLGDAGDESQRPREPRRTDLSVALERVSHVTDKSAIVFLISDFLDDGYEDALKIVSKRHELVPVVLADPTERADTDEDREGTSVGLPDMGIVPVRDPETGRIVTVDTSSRRVRDEHRERMQQMREYRNDLFRKYDIDPLEIPLEDDHGQLLVSYFQRRNRRR